MPSRWKKAVLGALALGLFAALVARTTLQLARAPERNWDMLPAMALALEWYESDPVELHRRTYEAARAELGPETYQALTASGVLAVRARDPAAFHEHLAFYRARVLYTLAIAALHGLGAPLSAATYWIPIACWAAGALLFLVWARRHLPLGLAVLFALGLAHTPALLNQAGTSSADGLATLATLVGAWALLERRSFALAALFLVLAIGARPDAVIVLAFTSVALRVHLPRQERPSARSLGTVLALGLALFLGLRRFGGEYGWWPLVQISFVEKAVHPGALATAVDWGEYQRILARQVLQLPGEGYVQPASDVTGSTLVFFYAAVAVVGIRLARRERRAAALLAALLASYLVRFLLFPQLWDRFFAPFYALVPLGLLVLLSAELRARASPS